MPFALLVLAVRRRPPRSVALVRQAPLPSLLAPGRIGDAVVVVRVVRPLPPCPDRLFRRLSRDQAIAARADEVLPPGLEERLPHGKPVLRLEELQERPL